MLEVSRNDWRLIYPNAPGDILDAFAMKADVLRRAGILESRTRLSYFCANVEHECGGFTIRNLTENVMYTAARMAQVWPNRFASASAVVARYGSGPNWQLRAFDEIYGNRMGNRMGTHDGSTFIGRGGPQATGRDGYREVGARAGRDFESDYQAVSSHDLQPEVCAAFWTWKGMNRFADAGDFLGCVKSWNGGTNGLADRKALMAGNDPVVVKIQNVANAAQVIDAIDAPSIVPTVQPVHDARWVQSALNRLQRAGAFSFGPDLETTTGIYGTKTRDAVAIRCFKAGVAFPAEWRVYVEQLREIVRADSGELPKKPAFPEGT